MEEQTDLIEKKEDLKSLVTNGCPMGEDFINSNCPVKNVRKLTAKNLGDYVNSLSEEQIDNIFNYHEDCNGLFSF